MIINKYRHCIGCFSYNSKDEECAHCFVMPICCPCQKCLVKSMCHKPCEKFEEYYADEKGIPVTMRNVRFSSNMQV